MEFLAFRNRQCSFPLMMSWRPSEQGSLTWQVLLPYAMWLGLLPPATYKDTLLSTQCNYRPSMTRKTIFTVLPGSVRDVQVHRLSSEYAQKLNQPPGWYLEVILALLFPICLMTPYREPDQNVVQARNRHLAKVKCVMVVRIVSHQTQQTS